VRAPRGRHSPAAAAAAGRSFPASHVFRVVSNVDEYKSFVPWCVGSRVLGPAPGGAPGGAPGARALDAELQVGFALFTERYTSRVTLVPDRRVLAEARDTNLFVSLSNAWAFEPGPGGPGTTALDFSVDFQFRSPLYAHAATLFFNEVVLKMGGAFERRCAEVWEREAPARAAAAAAEARAAAAAARAAAAERAVAAERAAAAAAAAVARPQTVAAAAAASHSGGGGDAQQARRPLVADPRGALW